MKSSQRSLEFETEIDEQGVVVVPSGAFERLNVRAGSKIYVRVTTRSLGKELTQRGVTEEEVEHLGMLQMEPRENVIRFLTAEGSLARNKKFLRRVKELFA